LKRHKQLLHSQNSQFTRATPCADNLSSESTFWKKGEFLTSKYLTTSEEKQTTHFGLSIELVLWSDDLRQKAARGMAGISENTRKNEAVVPVCSVLTGPGVSRPNGFTFHLATSSRDWSSAQILPRTTFPLFAAFPKGVVNGAFAAVFVFPNANSSNVSGSTITSTEKDHARGANGPHH
jgi:hypothetical protein